MASFQKVKTDGKRARPSIKSYRITTKPRGFDNRIVIDLSAKQYTEQRARIFHGLVEEIETGHRLGIGTPPKTKETLDLYPDFKERLAEKGIIPALDVLTVAELWRRYIQEQGEKEKWAPNTYRNKGVSRKKLFGFFREDQRVDKITKQDARLFKEWIFSTMKKTTANGHFKDVKACFSWAAQVGILEKDPFKDLHKESFENKSREEYITLETFSKLLDACPSQEWRVILFLWRRQGLRKNEPQGLKWEHVDFQKGMMTIPSPKTKRHSGKEKRVVPMFPDTRKELEALQQEQTATGKKSAFVLCSERNKEFYAPFKRIVSKAGLKAWERLIQNLRASAAIDVMAEFGTIAESEWIGHSPQTARKHYLHTPPATLEKARQWNGAT